MHPAETTTTLPSFDEITLPEPLAGDAGSLAAGALGGLRQWLCSAEIRYDPTTLAEHARLWVCDTTHGRWTRIFDEIRSFDTASPEGIRTAATGVDCRTSVFVDPDSGRESLLARFDSPLGTRLLRLSDDAGPTPVVCPLATSAQGVDDQRMLWFDGRVIGSHRDRDGQDHILGLSSADTDSVLPGGPSTPGRFLSGLLAHGDALYLTLTNRERGFEVWKTSGRLDHPDWTPVIERGAQRYAQNQEVLAAFAHRQDLILIAGASPAERTPESKFFDYQGFEVIRLGTDGTCELLAGVPRFSPQGLLVPLSGRGPNLERNPRLEFVCAAEHAGHLVIGVSDDDGFRLWISADGEDWHAFTTDELRAIYRVPGCRLLSWRDRLTLLMETREVSGQARTRVLTARLDADALGS